MTMQILADHVRPLTDNERFRFRCHPEVSCFTECCRDLELALSPYDVLRLRKHLGLSSADFLERYVIVEQQEGDAFPQAFLAMVDDGRASCPFVGKAGCTVYPDRPGACRTYPLGRGASLREDGSVTVMHILLTEPHCQGFGETGEQDVTAWTADQELAAYHRMNDQVLAITQHQQIRNGLHPSPTQATLYLTALYDLDTFRHMFAGTVPGNQALPAEDEALLTFAVEYLRRELYGD